MRHSLLPLVFTMAIFSAGYSQEFPLGQVKPKDFSITVYDKDTSAVALVLTEMGSAHIDRNSFKLLFEYYAKVIILKPEGLDQANITIPLYKGSSGKSETLVEIQATTHNLKSGYVEETKLDNKRIYNESFSKYWDAKKFAMPQVSVGSILEYRYVLESPFIYKFRSWNFQADIPKLYSEYRALIPGNYLYNMTLKGFLKLSKNENSIVQKCITYGSAHADCAQYKFVMQNIPAFKDEEYMTAKSNYLSSINFELSEIKYFDGRVDKITKEWKDVENELKRELNFGNQLKKGKDIADEIAPQLTATTNTKEKATKIYDFVKFKMKWNGIQDFISDQGIKKAFTSKTGSIADINLGLIALLDYAGLQVEPVLLSTRDNGFATELHPVLSDFNYVIARLTIDNETFLLDASDPYLTFGMLPERCLGGKGRVFGEKGSYWIDIKSSSKKRIVTTYNLNLDESGSITGSGTLVHIGHAAVEKRKTIFSFSSINAYTEEWDKKNSHIEIKNYVVKGLEDYNSPITEQFDITINGIDDSNPNLLLINPFIYNKIERNPFTAPERLFPVDFGVPVEHTLIFNLTYPDKFLPTGLPDEVGVSLPNGGGRLILSRTGAENKITINYQLEIAKPIYQAQEYKFIRELYARAVQLHNSDIILERLK